jgi:hypothetical protein
MGDLLDLGVQADHVRGEGAETDAGRDGRRGLLSLLQFQVGLRSFSSAASRVISAEVTPRPAQRP